MRLMPRNTVGWEMTKACNLSCRHCRARAIKRALPGELSLVEGNGITTELNGLGVETEYVGAILSSYIKKDFQILTF